MLQALAVLEWNKYSPENQDFWKYYLLQLVDSPKCKVSRICFPVDKGSLFIINLVYVADFAINAGETADYTSTPVGFTWSCALVAPISNLLEDESTQNMSSPLKPLIPEMEIPGLSA